MKIKDFNGKCISDNGSRHRIKSEKLVKFSFIIRALE
jgi:hypothetical protein